MKEVRESLGGEGEKEERWGRGRGRENREITLEFRKHDFPLGNSIGSFARQSLAVTLHPLWRLPCHAWRRMTRVWKQGTELRTS